MKKISNFVRHPLFTGSAVMVIGSNLVSFLNYLYHLVMGRMLGPSGYGELASLISIIGLLGVIPGSINLVIIKYVSGARDENETDKLIHWLKAKSLRIIIIFCLVVLALSPLISSFLNIRIFYLWLIAVSFLFSLQSMINRAILQGLLRFKEMVFSLLTENTAKLLIGMFLVLFGLAVGGAMWGIVIAALLGLYITNLYLNIRRKNMLKLTPDIKSMLKFTIPVIIQSISTTSMYSSDVILVKHFFTSHEAGIYASLSTLGKIIFFGAGPIGSVMFPLVSLRKSRGENYQKIFFLSFLATLLFAVGIAFIYFVAPQFAIKMLFGSAYLESSKLLIWFGFFIGMFTLSVLLINFGLSLGRIKIVILPLLAAGLQIMLIIFFHQSLFSVVFVSTLVAALLLASLLIYLILGKTFKFEDIHGKNKFNLNNRPSL